MDGLGISADQEPHFILKPPVDEGPELSEADEEAMEEIEDAIDDGEPCTDVGKALKEHAADVKKAVDKLTSGDKSKPECPV